MNREQMIADARKRVEQFDAMDASHGFATPQDVGEREVIRVSLEALGAALAAESWDCVADAYVMLEKLQGRKTD